jgi:hypothetical protein
VNLPLSRDGRQRRGGRGRPIEAKHHAVGIDSPHAGIDRTGLQVRDLEVQAAFRRLGEGTAFGFAHRELDPAFPVSLWQLHRGRSNRRKCAKRDALFLRYLGVARILRWVDQLSTRDSACSVSRVRYIGEASPTLTRVDRIPGGVVTKSTMIYGEWKCLPDTVDPRGPKGGK